MNDANGGNILTAVRTKSRGGKIALAGLVAVAMLLTQLLFFPLPKPMLRYLTVESADTMLNDSERKVAGIENFWRIFSAELVQQSLISHFHDRHSKKAWSNDATYAGMLLHRLRPTLISQREIYHESAGTPTAIAGLGWCDEVNGIAGRLLAQDFDKVEIVGVRDKKAGGHSFGRFWSPQYADWLYFDIWTEEVLIFRARPNAAPEYLYRSRPIGPSVVTPDDFALLTKLHSGTERGFVHNRLQDTVGGYFGTRIANIFAHGSPHPQEFLATLKVMIAENAFEPVSWRKVPRHSTPLARTYGKARVAHMLGDDSTARRSYRLVAERDPESSYGLASKKFLERLSTNR